MHLDGTDAVTEGMWLTDGVGEEGEEELSPSNMIM